MELNPGEIGIATISLLVALEALKYGKIVIGKKVNGKKVNGYKEKADLARTQMQGQIKELHEVLIMGKDGKEGLVTQVAINTRDILRLDRGIDK